MDWMITTIILKYLFSEIDYPLGQQIGSAYIGWVYNSSATPANIVEL